MADYNRGNLNKEAHHEIGDNGGGAMRRSDDRGRNLHGLARRLAQELPRPTSASIIGQPGCGSS